MNGRHPVNTASFLCCNAYRVRWTACFRSFYSRQLHIYLTIIWNELVTSILHLLCCISLYMVEIWLMSDLEHTLLNLFFPFCQKSGGCWGQVRQILNFQSYSTRHLNVLIIKPTRYSISQLYFGKELHMFRTDLLSIMRSLNTVFTAIGICHASYVDCLLANSQHH
jgi:hypothetical protein